MQRFQGCSAPTGFVIIHHVAHRIRKQAVSQRGHLVKPTGARRTWAVMYRDGDGNLRWEGKFHNRTDAQRRLTSVLGEIDKGTYTRPSSLTFEQFSKEWLAGRRQLRGSTESGYESVIKSQLIPRLGSLTVSHIRFEHIDAAVSGMVEDELAPKTIHNAVMLLRNMLTGRKGPSAFRRNLAFADHTLGVKLPPLEYRQIVPPTAEQVWKLIDVAREIGGVGYPITYLGAFCGLRRAEALGLRFVSVRWFDKLRSAFSTPSRNGGRRTEFTSGSGTSGLRRLEKHCEALRRPRA